MPTICVSITNRHAVFEQPYPWDELRDFFSFHPAGYAFMPKYRQGLWDGRIHMLKYDKVPTGLFLALKEKAEQELDVDFVLDWDILPVRFNRELAATDRSYQAEAVRKMQDAAQKGGGLVLSATGTGKTRITGMLFKSLVGRAVFVVDELTLMVQAQEELTKVLGEKVGQIGNSVFEPQRVTVATVQTLHKHRKRADFRRWAKGLDLMVIDELHVQLNRRNFTTVEAIKPRAVFGLTATLQLKKEAVRMRSWALAGPVCFEYSLKEGTDAGYLSKGVAIQVTVQTSEDWVKHSGDIDDYRDDYVRFVVRNRTRNRLIQRIAKVAVQMGRRVIILVERIEHLERLSYLLRDIRHTMICGEVEVDERVRAKKSFSRGTTRLLIANKVFKKGVDIREVDLIIDGAALTSRSDSVQKFGRGVRQAEGKHGLIYIDIGDSGNRFYKATKIRRLALKRAGVKVYRLEAKNRFRSVKYVKQFIQKAILLSQGNPANDAERKATDSKTSRQAAVEGSLEGMEATSTGNKNLVRSGRRSR